MTRRQTAWTLVELLVVLAIIGVLLALVLPAVQRVREAANQAQCRNNLRQLALATHHFHQVYRHFPVRYGWDPQAIWYNWAVALLPYLEQQPLYDQIMAIEAGEFYDQPGPNSVWARAPAVFVCPSDYMPGQPCVWSDGVKDVYCGISSYMGNGGTTANADSGIISDPRFVNPPRKTPVRLSDVTDGTSCTLMFGERYTFDPLWAAFADSMSAQPPMQDYRFFVPWFDSYLFASFGITCPGTSINFRLSTSYNNDDLWPRLGAYGSGHPGGAHVAFVDGSVRFLHNSLPYEVLSALSTRAGGEIIPDDF
jgi:prepilin-type processing-associated H-X9-DG protein